MSTTRIIARQESVEIVDVEKYTELRAQRDDMLALIKKAIPWMGLLIANGGHKNAAAPEQAEAILERMEAIARAERGAK